MGTSSFTLQEVILTRKENQIVSKWNTSKNLFLEIVIGTKYFFLIYKQLES